MLTVTAVVEFASSLSLLAVLLWSVPHLRTRLPEAVIGAAFGVLAALQMHAPMVMQPGVIIDLRCITVGLAAAILRPAGFAACLTLAIAARLQIGGIGAPSGIAAIAASATGARIWAGQVTARALHPTWTSLLLLAFAVSAHLLTLPLLPADVARRFISGVAPYLLLTNLLAVPLLGALAFRGTQGPAAREAWLDAGSGLLSTHGLRAAWSHRGAAALPSRGTGLAILRLRHGRWTTRTFGGATLDLAMGALRARLDSMLPRDAMVARLGGTDIAVVWPDVDEIGHRAQAMGLARLIGDRPVVLSDGTNLSVPLVSGQAWTRLDPDLDALLAEARSTGGPAHSGEPALTAAA